MLTNNVTGQIPQSVHNFKYLMQYNAKIKLKIGQKYERKTKQDMDVDSWKYFFSNNDVVSIH